MDNYPTMQELFDAIAYVPASHLVMYMEADAVAYKHFEDLKKHGLTDAYFDDMAAVAAKYGVKFVNPKYKAGLKPVENRPTVH